MKKDREFWERVRRAYENGEGSYRVLAERFGVSYGSVVYHGQNESWRKKGEKKGLTDMRAVTGKLSEAAMREIGRLEEQEADVKTIRDLTALVKELNLLMKNTEEESENTVRVQWGEEAEEWGE